MRSLSIWRIASRRGRLSSRMRYSCRLSSWRMPIVSPMPASTNRECAAHAPHNILRIKPDIPRPRSAHARTRPSSPEVSFFQYLPERPWYHDLKFPRGSKFAVIPSVARDVGGRWLEDQSSRPRSPRSLATLGMTECFQHVRTSKEVSCDARLLRHAGAFRQGEASTRDRKSTRLNSSHLVISYAVFS